jgi:hypothetical protein
MPTYVEYNLEDGSTLLVEVEEQRGIVSATSKPDEPIASKLGFKRAFASVRSSIKEVIAEFDDLHVEEAEIKFGIKSIGEAGIFAIGKVGGEMNYEVTLKWKKTQKTTK